MFGYSLQLDDSDVIYNLTHEELLSEDLNTEWIVDQMITATYVPKGNQGDKFEDKRFTTYTTIMLGMTQIPGQKGKIKKRGN